MLISQQHYGYNRYRASQPKPLRRLLDYSHGVPDGHRTAGETGSSAVATALGRGQDLASQGFAVDFPIMCWGDDPTTMFKVRAGGASGSGGGIAMADNGEPDFDALIPAPDMIATGPKPFSPWGYRPDPNLNTDADKMEINGVGWLYPSAPVDPWDVGARYADGDKKYEKTAWNGPYGHVIIAWERIA